MKKLAKFLVPVAVAAFALVSCNKENDIQISDPETVTIRVHASADELKSEDPQLKTYIDTYQGTPNTILWGTGEYMKLCITSGEGETAENLFVNSTDASADAFDGKPTALFKFSVTPQTADSYLYQGLYPASAAATSENKTPANYKVNLPATQNATASSYDPAAYILVAKPETFTSVQTDWVASYRRATALNKITLKNVPSGVSINRVKISAEGKKLAGGRHFDLTKGEGTDVYGTEESIEVKYATALTGTDVDVWFTSWDVEIAESEKLTIIAYTTDSKSYTKEITVPTGKTITFKEGFLNTLGANLSGITPKTVTELQEGSYVVLAKDGDNYYALKAEKEAGKERLLSVEYTGSETSYFGDADIIWNLTKSGNSYIFENSNKYLGYKGSSNESYWLEASNSWTETNYLLDVIFQDATSTYYVRVHSNDSRYLSKNSSGSFFAFYGNTDQKANIVFVPATVDSRIPVTLTFGESEISKTTANYTGFTGQTATATPSSFTGSITYVMTGDAIGSINATTGAVTLNGSTGTATVTASFAGDETYRPATASYTIVVSSATGPQYELVSTVKDVVEGQYVITWDNKYYLPSGSTVSSNPPVGTGITVSDNKLTNTVTEGMLWTFTGNNNDGFTIKRGNNYLNSANSTQGISISADANTTWTVSLNNNYGMLLTGSDAGSRYLAVYSNATWRYYATGSSYTGVLRLYKLADTRIDPGMSWPSATASATITNSGIEFTAPTLTVGNATDITYESTNTGVATVSANGTVTVVGPGKTTINAIFAGNDTYKPQTVSYTLTVTDDRTFTITCNTTGNGRVTATPTSAKAGDTVSLTIAASEGYKLSSITATDANSQTVTLSGSGNTRTFTMPVSDVTVNAVFEENSGSENEATIAFGNNGVKVNSASVTGVDSKNNSWTITTEGTTSFTPNTDYSQIGSSKNPASSITFTTTLPNEATNVSLEAKFGGFSGTAGDVTLIVDGSTIGTGSLNETSDVTISSTATATDPVTVLTVTVTNISKGVKVYYIKATYTN